MKRTKYFIEGVDSAHKGYIRSCRYNKDDNREDWFAGYDSVDRSHAVLKIPCNKGADLDLVYIGSFAQCSDKVVTLGQIDHGGKYAVYKVASGKPC